MALIGLLSPGDRFYAVSFALFTQARRSRTPLVTTSAIVFEILDGAAERDRRLSSTLRGAIEAFEIEVVLVDEALMQGAWTFYESRPDKAWSLTDCTSFMLMKERGLTEALTHDHHFEQAGFRALLRPN